MLSFYQVIEGEQAGVLGQQIRPKLSSTQRQKDARQGLTILRSDLQNTQNTDLWLDRKDLTLFHNKRSHNLNVGNDDQLKVMK